MTLRRYERYKDSGVEWLGAVPAHWNVLQLRRVIDRIEQGWSPECENRPAEEGEWGVLKTGCVNGGRFDPLENKALPNHLAAPPELEVAPNDLLMSRASGSPELVGSAALVNDTPPRLLLSDKTFRLHVNQRVDKQFLAWCLGSRLLRAQIECAISGAAGLANNLPQASLVEFVSPFPPVHEQRGIATYLNREAAKIDALIVEQQRLIELLSEKRQAVVAHTVTKGLNPAAPTKDSGVHWLGKVPTHWKVVRLGQLSIGRCDGPFGSGLKSEHYTDSGVRVVRLQNIRSEGFNGQSVAYIDSDYYSEHLGDHDVRTGDLLIAGLGDERNTVGRACVAPDGIEPAMVKADCFRFRLDGATALPTFVAFALNASAAADAGYLAGGSTRSRIPLSIMASRHVPLPPIEEQARITSMLSRTVSEVDRLCVEAEHAIALLRERRTALVSAAVTGQIDVRQSSPAESTFAAHLQPHD